MHHKIKDIAALPMVWNDGESIWEIDFDQIKGPLASTESYQAPTCPCADGADGAAEVEHDEIWGRAVATPFPTVDDVAHMLGSALTQAAPNANVTKGHRPLSDGLVHMLDAAINDGAGADLSDEGVGAIIRQLAPIIASVDQNAHLRGVREGRGLAVKW